MRTISLTLAAMTAMSCAVAIDLPRPESAAQIVSWNELVLSVAEEEDRLLTLKGLRTTAMMHLAIHDALNAVDARHETWLERRLAKEAAPAAAIASAAFEVAQRSYPDRRGRFQGELEKWLGTVEEGSAKERGVALGTDVATAVITSRMGDRWNAEAEYEWHPMAPGVYAEFSDHSATPEGFVFGSGWAIAKPFTLESPSQFRVPPPPPIESDAYTRAFNEVKEVGAWESKTRTADQAHLAMWWKDFVENSHNRLARKLVIQEDLDQWTAARLFALLNISIYDAYINVFDNKFHYNHWRPYTAIRWASNDGNPETDEDPDWNNLHRHTYAFPSYPSAHGTASAAAMTVLADTFGEDRPFTMRTERVDRAGPLSEKILIEPPTRSFGSFAEAAEECSLSRIYLGIHFRYDSTAGTDLGRRIGSHVVGHFLRREKSGAPQPEMGNANVGALCRVDSRDAGKLRP